MSSSEALVHALAVACAAVAATTNLVVAVAVVPFWKSLDPDEFLDWFARYASRFGMISPPFGLLGAAFSTWAALVASTGSVRFLWLLSAALLGYSLAVLPMYFVRANTRIYKRSIPSSEVSALVLQWSRWHLGRTISPLAAVVAAVLASATAAG